MATDECRFTRLSTGEALDDDDEAYEVVGKMLAETEPLRAAACWQRSLLESLHLSSGSTLISYLERSHRIHRTRAAGLLGQGDVEGALKENAAAEKVLPADASLVEAVYPRLVAAGREDDANGLLDRVQKRAEAAFNSFSRSSSIRENLERLNRLRPAGRTP